jgi:sortase A
VTHLSVTFSETKADMTPAMLPDLYHGEPLVLTARLGKLAGTMEIKGRIGDRPWSVTLPLANAAEGRGLSKLWARRKIADAEVAQTLRTLTADEANKTILALALEHQLVTRLTSLIAVDQTVTRPAGESLKVSELPVSTGHAVKPWPWADTWPEARITVKRIGASAIALAGSSGQALAFGPGHMERTADAGERGVAVFAAHRDTHFRFLKDVAVGDEIDVTRHDGKTFRYRADGASIVRFDQSDIDPFTGGYALVLTTCWPFDAIAHGPMRYVLHATMISPATPAAEPASPL